MKTKFLAVSLSGALVFAPGYTKTNLLSRIEHYPGFLGD